MFLLFLFKSLFKFAQCCVYVTNLFSNIVAQGSDNASASSSKPSRLSGELELISWDIKSVSRYTKSPWHLIKSWINLIKTHWGLLEKLIRLERQKIVFAQNKSAVLLRSSAIADTKSVVLWVSGSSLHRKIVTMTSKTVRAPRLIPMTKRLNTTH